MKVDLTRLERIDYLIRTKSTGTPKELATRLGLSVRSWHNLKDEMINQGAPIVYSKTFRSYYYAEKEGFRLIFFRGEN